MNRILIFQTVFLIHCCRKTDSLQLMRLINTKLILVLHGMAIMTAVAKQYGRAHKAFVIVPLACGIFIDIINSLSIALFAAL